MTDVATEYKKLVRAPATLQNLRRSVTLVRDIVREHFPSDIDWDRRRILNFWGEEEAPSTLGSIRRSNVGFESPSADYDIHHRLAEDVVVTLVLGSTDIPDDIKDETYSLLFDALLVLFHQSYFALLPSLKRSDADYKALLNSYIYLTSRIHEHADVFRIAGLVLLATGDYQKAKANFRGALLATHSDEHDFMTRLQNLWHMMLEEGAHKEALDLLIEVAPKVTRQDFDEFSELLRETFQAAESTRRDV